MTPESLLSSEIVEESIKKDFGRSDIKLLSWKWFDNCASAGDNFFNVVKRIEAQYLIDQTEKQITYIAKLNPCKRDDFFNPYRERAMTKEVFFYKDLVPLLNFELEKMGSNGLCVPRYIHSSIIPEREVIILEDLKPKGFVTSSTKEMDQNHSEILAKEICKLHVASVALEKSLGGKKLEEAFPLLIESWLVGEEKLRYAFDGIFKKGLRHTLKLTNALDEFKDLIPSIETLKNREMELLVKEFDSRNRTRVICHGDYHRTNVMFRYNEEEKPVDLMIIDWQTVRVANVGADISYLLFSSYFGPSRNEYFPFIIKTYQEKRYSLLGTESSQSLQELEDEVKNNRFGFLICFYLFPLCLSVSDPSEFFKLEKEDGTKVNETLESVKDLLKSKENLHFVLTDYLSYYRNNLKAIFS